MARSIHHHAITGVNAHLLVSIVWPLLGVGPSRWAWFPLVAFCSQDIGVYRFHHLRRIQGPAGRYQIALAIPNRWFWLFLQEC